METNQYISRFLFQFELSNVVDQVFIFIRVLFQFELFYIVYPVQFMFLCLHLLINSEPLFNDVLLGKVNY